MTAESDNCCSRCLGFITTMGLAALFIWLSLRVDEPKCYIDYIYIPALNKTLNSPFTTNSTLNFTLKLVNPNKDKGIKYDAVRLRFAIFIDHNTTRPIGNATVGGFYQGHEKKARKPGSLNAAAGNLTAKVDGKMYFRVEFDTAVKYKISLWYTKKRDLLWGGANVEIGDSGVKVHRKAIRLGDSQARIESGASKLRGCYRALLPFLVAVLLVLHAPAFT